MGIAARVASADAVRLRSLAYVRDLGEGELHAAVDRVAENRCLVAWVRAELTQRSASYRFALEHLLIETPQGHAVPTERALARFDAHLVAIGVAPVALDGCAGDAILPPAVRVPQSRAVVIGK